MPYSGLTSEEVKQRIEKGETNQAPSSMVRSVKDIILSHALTYFNFINTVLFVIVLLSGKITNALFYFTVIISTFIGIWQELKARKLLLKMEMINKARYQTLRDGQYVPLLSDELVRDDIIILESGLPVPADGIVLSGTIELNESVITGESRTVIKNENGEIYGGTVVTAGKATVRIVHVGSENTAAKIMEEGRQFKDAKSRLAQEMEKLLKVISVVIIPAGIAIFLTQWLRTGMPVNEAAIKTVAAVVGMIPEGLAVLTSGALALSAIRLARTQVLVHEMHSIESLARVDVLCLDKTGTLTKGSMKTEKHIVMDGVEEETALHALRTLLKALDAHNATSSALMETYGTDSDEETAELIPFSSERKYSGVITAKGDAYLLGAPKILLGNRYPQVLEQCNEYAKLGTRVVTIGRSQSHTKEDFEPYALFLISDELRDNTREIMEYFGRQNVSLKVISGDDPSAVSAIAYRAGIPYAHRAIDLSSCDQPFDEIVEHYTVFGGVKPLQKKELVEALKRKGHTVAMTGDGVNDVPSLKCANVSVAMAAGAPAARDSANFVLMDNDFSRMPSIVDEGRRVINNISRASAMYLVKTGFSALLSIYVIILAHTYPFVPVQLTLISAAGVGIPTAILQLEPSFEMPKKGFLGPAITKAGPSAIMVMLTVFVCVFLREQLHLTPERYSGILMAMTGGIYLFTLTKVYRPLTKGRSAVISAMGILLICAIFFAGRIFSATLIGLDFLIVGIGYCLIPLGARILTGHFEKAIGHFLPESEN